MNREATTHELFEQQVIKYPNLPAVQFNNRSLSYKEFNQKANQLAHYLKSKGIQPDTPVAVAMERSIEQLIAIFAILKAGGAYAPLDPNHPENRLLLSLNDMPFLIIHPQLEEKFTNYGGTIIQYKEQCWKKRSVKNLKIPIASNNLAYIIYTSGSTGTPKGVMIEHASLINYSEWFYSYSHCSPGQRVDYSSNYTFDMAITNTLLPLMLGLSVIICDEVIKKDLHDYLKFLQENKINLIKITPSYFRALLYEISVNPLDLPELKTLILGGEQLGVKECKAWVKYYPHHTLFNEYGPTETTVAVSCHQVTPADLKNSKQIIPIGKSGNNITFYILDEEKNLVSPGKVGELYIGGSCLARGYLNLPEISEQRFIQIPALNNERLYKTGDLCIARPGQVVEYLGRVDHQIKIRGFRVELNEIENSLNQYPALESIAVVSHEIADEQQLVAYYTLEKNHVVPSFQQLRTFLKKLLPDYMIPIAFIKLDKFPLNANGKLDKALLPKPKFSSLLDDIVPPKTEEEKTLITIWQEELGIENISMDANFFEMGGHSLTGARIISRLRQTFTKDIKLNDLYNTPTPASILKLMHGKNKITFKSPSTEFTKAKLLPLNDFQFTLWIANLLAPKLRKLNLVGRKRFQGEINLDALNFAFKQLFLKHHILSYRIFKWKPAQSAYQAQFSLVEKNIQMLSRVEQELKLLDSVDELINFYPWSKKSPLLIARLYYLNDANWELQLSMPHIISDELSVEILFSEISDAYLSYEKGQKEIQPCAQFYDYIQNSYQHDDDNERAFSFWKDYLKDTRLFNFPAETILKAKLFNNFHYSTYTEISESVINKVQFFCIEHRVNVNDALSAALAMALTAYADLSHPTITMNRVKSTRDNPTYDKTIGCFIRIEPIKIKLDNKDNLLDYAKKIHESLAYTEPYNASSILTKLAALKLPSNLKVGYFTKKAIQLVSRMYLKFFPSLHLPSSLALFLEKLSLLNKRKEFIIHVNLWNNFLSYSSKQDKNTLFNIKNINLPIPHYDLVRLDYLLDVCFMRDNNSFPYLVISSNLKPEFRAKLGQEIIRILDNCLNSMQSNETEISSKFRE